MFTPSKRLQKLYERFNRLYFDNELPHDTLVGWMDFPKHSPLGRNDISDGDGILHHTIYISEFLKPFRGVTKETVLHEMCHIKLYPYGKHDRRRFDAEMLRIASAGALHDIW